MCLLHDVEKRYTSKCTLNKSNNSLNCRTEREGKAKMSGQIRNSLAEREKTNFEARTVPFFMIDKQHHPFHASIQIHPDFFLALFQRITLQISRRSEIFNIKGELCSVARKFCRAAVYLLAV